MALGCSAAFAFAGCGLISPAPAILTTHWVAGGALLAAGVVFSRLYASSCSCKCRPYRLTGRSGAQAGLAGLLRAGFQGASGPGPASWASARALALAALAAECARCMIVGAAWLGNQLANETSAPSGGQSRHGNSNNTGPSSPAIPRPGPDAKWFDTLALASEGLLTVSTLAAGLAVAALAVDTLRASGFLAEWHTSLRIKARMSVLRHLRDVAEATGCEQETEVCLDEESFPRIQGASALFVGNEGLAFLLAWAAAFAVTVAVADSGMLSSFASCKQLLGLAPAEGCAEGASSGAHGGSVSHAMVMANFLLCAGLVWASYGIARRIALAALARANVQIDAAASKSKRKASIAVNTVSVRASLLQVTARAHGLPMSSVTAAALVVAELASESSSRALPVSSSTAMSPLTLRSSNASDGRSSSVLLNGEVQPGPAVVSSRDLPAPQGCVALRQDESPLGSPQHRPRAPSIVAAMTGKQCSDSSDHRISPRCSPLLSGALRGPPTADRSSDDAQTSEGGPSLAGSPLRASDASELEDAEDKAALAVAAHDMIRQCEGSGQLAAAFALSAVAGRDAAETRAAMRGQACAPTKRGRVASAQMAMQRWGTALERMRRHAAWISIIATASALQRGMAMVAAMGQTEPGTGDAVLLLARVVCLVAVAVLALGWPGWRVASEVDPCVRAGAAAWSRTIASCAWVAWGCRQERALEDSVKDRFASALQPRRTAIDGPVVRRAAGQRVVSRQPSIVSTVVANPRLHSPVPASAPRRSALKKAPPRMWRDDDGIVRAIRSGSRSSLAAALGADLRCHSSRNLIEAATSTRGFQRAPSFGSGSDFSPSMSRSRKGSFLRHSSRLSGMQSPSDDISIRVGTYPSSPLALSGLPGETHPPCHGEPTQAQAAGSVLQTESHLARSAAPASPTWSVADLTEDPKPLSLPKPSNELLKSASYHASSSGRAPFRSDSIPHTASSPSVFQQLQ